MGRMGGLFPYMDGSHNSSPAEEVLYYSIRSSPSEGPAAPLTGPLLAADVPDQAHDDKLLGQVEGVETGEVSGWACARGEVAQPLQVGPQVAA